MITGRIFKPDPILGRASSRHSLYLLLIDGCMNIYYLSCGNSSSARCYTVAQDEACMDTDNSTTTTFFNNSCVSLDSLCSSLWANASGQLLFLRSILTPNHFRPQQQLLRPGWQQHREPAGPQHSSQQVVGQRGLLLLADAGTETGQLLGEHGGNTAPFGALPGALLAHCGGLSYQGG